MQTSHFKEICDNISNMISNDPKLLVDIRIVTTSGGSLFVTGDEFINSLCDLHSIPVLPLEFKYRENDLLTSIAYIPIEFIESIMITYSKDDDDEE